MFERGEHLEIDEVTAIILDTAVHVHRRVGSGLLESLYVSVLAYELRQRGLFVEREKTITICYDGVLVEDAFRADLIGERLVIVEVKSVEKPAPAHKKQLLTYLRLADLRVGLLLNFGLETMKEGVKRVVNDYNQSSPSLRRMDRPS